MKAAFIVNPYSAKKNYQQFLKALLAKEPKAHYIISRKIEDTFRFIKETDADIFVAVGGDGTISTVAGKLINTGKILAVFPAGSGNGFAHETDFSKNLDQLLSKIKQGNYKEIDTFTVNGKLSINVAGVGLDGEIIKGFEKTNRGFVNYIKVTIKTFLNYRPIEVEFENRFSEHNGRYLMVNVANTRQFGNHAYIAPGADYSDGILDLALVKKIPFWYAPIFVFRMFTTRLVENKYLKYLQVSRINFKVRNSTSWHLDGEGNSIESPIEIKVLPKSLKILVS